MRKYYLYRGCLSTQQFSTKRIHDVPLYLKKKKNCSSIRACLNYFDRLTRRVNPCYFLVERIITIAFEFKKACPPSPRF